MTEMAATAEWLTRPWAMFVQTVAEPGKLILPYFSCAGWLVLIIKKKAQSPWETKTQRNNMLCPQTASQLWSWVLNTSLDPDDTS